MRVLDGVLLAAAKLKTHRVRTGIIIVIAALLFAGIALVLFMLTGAARSTASFAKEGLGSRYIVQASPILDYNAQIVGTPPIFENLMAKTTALKAEKKQAAKKLDISYDPTNDQTLPLLEYKMPDGSVQRTLNQASAFTKEAQTAYARALPHVQYEDFTKLARSNGALKTYRSATSNGPGFGQTQPTVSPILDAKEQFAESSKSSTMTEPRGVVTINTLGWSAFDTELLQPFLLPHQTLAVGKDGAVPVIAPMSAAEQILGLNSLPSTASSSQRLDRLVAVRKGIAGSVAELCYRNSASVDLYNQANIQEQEIARNKGNKNYTAPSLQYAAPTEPCGAVTIKKDTRSNEEKKQADNEISFKKQFEGYQDPTQEVLKVRIVGLSQDVSYQAGFSARGIIESILRSSLGQGWFSPSAAITTGSVASLVRPAVQDTTVFTQTYYAEFPTLSAAKNFAKQATCESKVTQDFSGMPQPGQADPRVADCDRQGKYYTVAPFGNNASAIEDLRQNVWKVMRYVAPAVLLIASLVLMGIVGKIIADSRRETAVFRALGATRFAIAQIYLTYSLFIAGIILVLSLGIGAIGAELLSNRLAPDASATAVLAYSAQDVHKQFVFFGVDMTYVAIVAGLIVLAALVSTLLPLLTNIRRNPIRDMRDEN